MENLNNVVVQKYGGSSVASPESIKKVAALIKARVDTGKRLCVVVSAMGKTTDQLLQQAKQISAAPSRRELDMLLSCGERASMALLAMALGELGVSCVSLTGSQSGIITDSVHAGAKIVEMRPSRVLEELHKGRVVIVAGFQGVSVDKEITTLGRGGSDTTAVALAAALQAECCEIYSDVTGVFTADPRLVTDAQLLESVDYDHMIEMARNGAKVLNEQAVRFAQEKGIVIHALKTGEPGPGTKIQTSQDSKRPIFSLAHKEHVLIVRTSDQNALCSALLVAQENHLDLLSIYGTDNFTLIINGDDFAHVGRLFDGVPQLQLSAASSIAIFCSQASEIPRLVIATRKMIPDLLSLYSTGRGLNILVKPDDLAPGVQQLHKSLFRENR